jgi:exodeoxyribonuclease V gamma subunit
LVDYISKAFKEKQEDISKLLITNHPLHGFSQRYFNQSGLVNYLSDEKYKSGIVEKAENGQQQTVSFDNIDVNKLANFFKDPVKFYFNNTLKIYYEDEKSLLPDSEIFELNNLEGWVLEEELLYKQIVSIEAYIEEKKMKGKIALKNMGTSIVETIQANVAPFKQVLDSIIKGKNKSSVNIHLKVEDTLITGKFEGCYEDFILNGSRSKSIQKHIVTGYVKYLVARAQGLEIDFIFLYKDGEDYKQFIIDKTSITQTEAFEKVKQLIAFYKSGHEQIFKFYPIIDKLYKYVSQDYAYFFSNIESDKKYGSNYVFNDEYLIKAIENGFFDEEHFEVLKENTIFLLKDLQIK